MARSHTRLPLASSQQRDWYLIAEEPAPAPYFAHPKGCAALRLVLVLAPCPPLLRAFSGWIDLLLLRVHNPTFRFEVQTSVPRTSRRQRFVLFTSMIYPNLYFPRPRNIRLITLVTEVVVYELAWLPPRLCFLL